MKERNDFYADSTNCIVLAILVIAPEFQGQGIGKLLLQDGLKKADQHGLPAWLEASSFGRPLYAKVGFQDVEDLVLDLGQYGGDGSYTTVCMERPAKAERVLDLIS
jgi:predicted N-acetyltransferase YhbS